MPTSVSIYSNATRPSASGNSGLSIFNSDSKQYQISDGTNWYGFDYDGITFDFSGSNSHSGVFDGASDWVVVGTMSELNSSSDFSVSAWFNLSAASNFESIFSGGTSTSARAWIQFPSSSSIRIGVNSGTNDFTVSTLTVDGTQWYHLVATVSGTTATLYLDGSSVGTATCQVPASTAFNDVRLGALNGIAFGGNTRPFNGHLDEIAIYNRAITSTEVSNIYNNKVYVAPTAMYRLDNDVTDETGNYNGTNNGVTFSTTDKPY
jgi:hypothetical protein